MRNAPINLIGGSNVDDSLPWLCEDTVNYVIEKAPSSGALTEYKPRDAPGLKPYVKGPLVDGNPAGPVRGAHDCEGKHFTVMGSRLYQITTNKIAIPLGTVPGTQRVNMAHNQIPGGNEVIITTGTPNGYVFNTVTQVFGRITDPGYPGGGAVDYIDTYLVSVEPFGRYWYWSDQASATSYNTLNRTEAEADPDSIVSIAVNAFEVVVFGQQSLEFFYNAGGINGNTFKSKRVMNGHGCAARDSVVKLDNTLFWLSSDGIVYRLAGYAAQPISTPQFTQRIKGKNWSKAFAYAYEDQGHVMYWITFPDGETFCFDVPVAAMTRRESYGLTRCRLNTLIKTAGKWVGGDFQSGLLYEMDWDYPMEGEGTNLVRQRTSGNTSNAQNKIEVPLLELIFETGSPQVEPVLFADQPEGPTITGALPDGSVGLSWAGVTYGATGGTPPYSFTSRPGTTWPGNLGPMSSAGVVAVETPTTAGMGVNIPRVTDANLLYDELTDEFTISNAVALLGGSTVTSRPFLLLGPGGTDWDNAYAYNGNTPLLMGTGLLGGGGRWLTWEGSGVSSPVYSTDATGTAWTTSAAVFESATKTQFGCYEAVSGAFLIPANNGVYRTVDHGVSLTKVTTIPAFSIDASTTLALAASNFEASVSTAPAPFTTWTLLPTAHNITFSSGGIVRYGGDQFLIGGGNGSGNPKLTLTAAGASFSTETLPTLTAGYISAAAYDPASETWVAGTSAGQFIYKVGAGAWTLSAYAFGTSVAVKSMEFAGPMFVAAGNHNVSAGLGVVAYSADGISWTTAPTLEAINAQALAVMK